MSYPAAYGPYREAYNLMLRREPTMIYRTSVLREGDTATYRFHVLTQIAKSRQDWLHNPPHPAVIEALEKFGHPQDWHQLVLENATLATDGLRVAYVRSDQKRQDQYCSRERNKFLTATTIGKYLARHWPHVASDRIRNVAAKYTANYAMLTTMEEMLGAIKNTTAESCMVYTDREIEAVGHHPYEVYDPKYGWKLAICKNGAGEIAGRALVYEHGDTKVFVRTYGLDLSDGKTQSHAGLEGWLESQGYSFEDEWPEGCRFRKLEHSDPDVHHVAPYLDPGAARVRSSNSRRVTDCGIYFRRSNRGEWNWDNTDGSPESTEERCTCDDCGSRVEADSTTCTGHHGEDNCVCSSCLDDNYTSVIGRNGHEYYVPNDEAVRTEEGEYYHERYLAENSIVTLHDGSYTHHDNSIYVESEDEYYHDTDLDSSEDSCELVVYAEDISEYVMRNDAKWCVHNGYWIAEEHAVEIAGGNFVHEDDFDGYLQELPRDEVAANCLSGQAQVDEKLAMWDDVNGVTEEDAESVSVA